MLVSSSSTFLPVFLPSFLCTPLLGLPLPFLCSAEPPTKYQISKPTVCSVHPGELLKLNCPLPGEVGTITWTKDGSSLGVNNRTLIEREVLQIRDASPKDSGLYACSTVGPQGSDTLCFIVNVTGESGSQAGSRTGDNQSGQGATKKPGLGETSQPTSLQGQDRDRQR